MTRARALAAHLRPGLPLDVHVEQGLAVQGALSTLGMLAQGGVRFLYTLLIRWGFGGAAGIVLVGHVNVCIAAALLGSLVVPLAAGNAASKHLGRLRGTGDTAAVRAVLAYLGRIMLVAATLIGLATAGYVYWRVDRSLVVAGLTGLLAVSYSMYMYVRGTLLGLGLLVRATLWDFLSAAIAVVGLVALVAGHVSEWLLAPLALCYAAYSLASASPVRGPGPDEATRASLRSFLTISVAQTLASSGFLQASQLAAQHWGTPLTTGHFALALSLATPASLVSRSLETVLFPRMAAAHSRGDSALLARQTDLATRWLVLVCVAVYGPLVVCTPLLLGIYGSGAGAAGQTLAVLLGATLLQNMVVATTDNLMSRDARHNRMVRDAAVGGAVLGIVAWVVLGPRFGVAGVAWGYLVGTVVASVVPAVIAWRLDAQPWAGLALRFLGAVVVVGAAAAWIIGTGQGAVVQLGLTAVLLALWLALGRADLRTMLAGRRTPA